MEKTIFLAITLIYLSFYYVSITPSFQVQQSQQNCTCKNSSDLKEKVLQNKTTQVPKVSGKKTTRLPKESTTLPYQILPKDGILGMSKKENQAKMIYFVTIDDKYANKKGILYSQEFFEQSKTIFVVASKQQAFIF